MDYQNNGNGSHFGNENDQTPQQYEQTAANAAAATSFMQHSGIGALSNQIAENLSPRQRKMQSPISATTSRSA